MIALIGRNIRQMRDDNVMRLKCSPELLASRADSRHTLVSSRRKGPRARQSTFQELFHVCRGKWHGHLSGNQRQVSARIWFGLCGESDGAREAEPL